MALTFTRDQEQLIQTKLRTGKYHSAEEVLDIALRLLDEYDRANGEWVEEIRSKIDAAIEMSKHTPPVDGKEFVDTILDRFQQVDE